MAASSMAMLLGRVALVQRHEWPAVLGAFAYFLCLLCGYYLLRPVRDEMGIQAGLAQLPWLFTATLMVMLATVPVFGWLSGRFPRRRLLPIVYLFFVANLAVFFLLFEHRIAIAHTARVFFVWVSVFNLFVVSVFWSFMADIFRTQAARRVYGLIAAGGSTGALAGPALAAILAQSRGVSSLLVLSAAFLLGALGCIVYLGRWARRDDDRSERYGAALHGGSWDGVLLVLRSRFLLAICGFVLLYSTLSTFLYFQQQTMIAAAFADPRDRTALFATLDLATNTLSLLVQLLVFGPLVRRTGLAAGLVLVPMLSVVGFTLLALQPTLAVLVVFGVARRAGEFALAKPAREALFNSLSRAEKYKAKNFMDTAVYRTGDAASAWLFEGLKALGLTGIAVLAAALALAWALLGRWLVRAHEPTGNP